MISVLQAVRVALANFRQSLEQTPGEGREALFEGRDQLREVADSLEATQNPHLVPLTDAMQFMLECLLRNGSLDMGTASEALTRLAFALGDMIDAPGGVSANPLAASYLGAGGLPQVGSVLRSDRDLHAGPKETIRLPDFLDEAPAPAPSLDPQVEYSQGAGLHPSRQAASLDKTAVTRLLADRSPTKETRLGQVLLRQNLINNGQLDRALALQQITRRKLGEVLVAMELIGVESLNRALDRQRCESPALIGDHAAPGQPLPKEQSQLRLLKPEGEA